MLNNVDNQPRGAITLITDFGPNSNIFQLSISVDTEGLTDWDSGLLTFLVKLHQERAGRGIETDEQGLPAGVQGIHVFLCENTVLTPFTGIRFAE
jgi:hypothetical protein